MQRSVDWARDKAYRAGVSRSAIAGRERQAEVDRVPFWWHTIDFGGGVRSRGTKTAAIMDAEWRTFGPLDVAGKSVLDIGAWDGGFSFRCEQAGAARVVALDDFAWQVPLGALNGPDWQPSPQDAVPDDPTLPGRVGFDLARRLLDSQVEPVVRSFAHDDLSDLGTFDIVLFLGVLYHLEEPFTALRRVFDLTAPGGACVIETQAILTPEPDRLLWEFFPRAELAGDPTNWWAPTPKALVAACEVAGFTVSDLHPASPLPGDPPFPGAHRLIARCKRPAAGAGIRGEAAGPTVPFTPR